MKRRTFIKTIGVGGVSLASVAAIQTSASSFSSSVTTAATGVPVLKNFRFESITVDQQGQQIARQQHQAQYFEQALSSDVAMEMVLIPANTTSQLFYLARYPVTQAQWRIVAGWPAIGHELNPDPACFKTADHPVECVSWLDADEFCRRLSAYSGLHYRLPDIAQWEYACKAGTRTPFHCGQTITSELANYGATHTYAAEAAGDYRRSTTPAGHFLPNAFGLHDMHGNVWEWCAGRVSGSATSLRPLRGGAWPDKPDKLRSAYRSAYHEAGLNRIIGFRVSGTV